MRRDSSYAMRVAVGMNIEGKSGKLKKKVVR